MTILREGLALVLMTSGSLLGLLAGLGVLRLPSLLTRMHAATKPQSLGVVLTLLGLALWLADGSAWAVLVLVCLFQLLTVPVAAHMEGRGALSTGLLDAPIHDLTDLTTHPSENLPDQREAHERQMAELRRAARRRKRGTFVSRFGRRPRG